MKRNANQNEKVRKRVIERSRLRKYLRNGDMKKIAELAGVSRNSIYVWFSGEVKTSIVEPYIELFVKTRKKQVETLIGEELRANL